jgi:hypothetical protein
MRTERKVFLATVLTLFVFEAWSQTSAQQSKQQTLTGIVSDAACGAVHGMKNMTAADCTLMCVKAGQKYALVVGKTVYTLQGHETDLGNLAAQTVTVTGTVSGKVVIVESVAAKRPA